MKVIEVSELHELFRAQGVKEREHIAFVCPVCGTVQSATSLIRAGAGKSLDEVEKFLGFSCVGRFTNAGPHNKKSKPGNGCDWTLGGFLTLHKLEVKTPDGKTHMTFEPATPEQAIELMNTYEAVPA